MTLTTSATFFLMLALFLFVVPLATAEELDIDAPEHSVVGQCDLFDPTADEIVDSNFLASTLGVTELGSLQEDLCKTGDCNISLCFALDGSGSVSETEFQVQKDFVNLIATLAAPANASFSAVQYGLSNTFISSNTHNVSQFTDSVENSELMKATRTFLSAGLAFCISQVAGLPERAGRKIVVLGDGQANFGEKALPIVMAAAGQADIYAVGVGFPTDSTRLLEITGGQEDRVFGISNFSEVPKVVVELTRALCNAEPKTPTVTTE